MYSNSMNIKNIPKGTKLYRGSRNSYESNGKTNMNGTFYALNKNTAKMYSGFVTVYTLKHDAHFLNMGNPATIRMLSSIIMDERLRFKLKKAFRVNNSENIVRRHSRLKYDAYVADLVCKLGYDGYYAPRLRTKYAEGYLAAEAVVCRPRELLQVTNKMVLGPPSIKNNRRPSRPNTRNVNFTVL